MNPSHQTLDSLVDALCRHTPLDGAQRAALLAVPYRTAVLDSGAYIVRDGDRAENCSILLSGFAYRSRLTADGARQILAVHMRGDAVDLQNSMMEVADHSVQTLTQADIACVPRQALLDLIAAHPRIGQALWRQTLIEASIAHEWMLNIGRRDARQRIAHFICEIAYLQKACGLANGQDYHWPLTQEQIADCAGLTSVHVNRTLQGLRAEGLVRTARQMMTIPDWNALRSVGSFRTAYLHQDRLAA